MAEISEEDLEEEVDEVEEDTSEEVMGEEAAHMKPKLTSQMSHVALKIKSGAQYQNIQGRGSLRKVCAQSSCQIKTGTPPALSVLKRIMIMV